MSRLVVVEGRSRFRGLLRDLHAVEWILCEDARLDEPIGHLFRRDAVVVRNEPRARVELAGDVLILKGGARHLTVRDVPINRGGLGRSLVVSRGYSYRAL